MCSDGFHPVLERKYEFEAKQFKNKTKKIKRNVQFRFQQKDNVFWFF